MVFLRLPFESRIKCVSFENDPVNVDEIRSHISSYWGIDDLTLYYNGKLLDDQHFVPRDATIQATFSLPGGKGGFGSMLRAIGAQIEKTTNREACRDLSGRRLRDINEEQRLKKWISKESEREAEKARRRQARIERLKTKPKHNFVDFEYEKEISELPERVDEALHAGMEKASKRPKTVEAACSVPPSKKKKLWMDEDLSGSSDSDSQEASSSSGNANSLMDNTHSRLEASGSESSNDTHLSESKHATVEEEVPMVVDSEASLDEKIEDQQISTNDDSIEDQASQNINAVQEQKLQETETLQEKVTLNIEAAVKEASVTDEHSASNGDRKEAENVQNVPVVSQQTVEVEMEDVDLVSFESALDLESLGLDRLKILLKTRGLKCGGTISERAQRLWLVRGLEPHEYPHNLLAKKKKK